MVFHLLLFVLYTVILFSPSSFFFLLDTNRSQGLTAMRLHIMEQDLAGIFLLRFHPFASALSILTSALTFPHYSRHKNKWWNRWTNATDLWLHGYCTWDWADSYMHVLSIDPPTPSFTKTNGRVATQNVLVPFAPTIRYLQRNIKANI